MRHGRLPKFRNCVATSRVFYEKNIGTFQASYGNFSLTIERNSTASLDSEDRLHVNDNQRIQDTPLLCKESVEQTHCSYENGTPPESTLVGWLFWNVMHCLLGDGYEQ